MRIKFLSVIVSFCLVSLAITSCLDTEKAEYSPDPTIHEFEIDTIHGVNYKFSINQVLGQVYNEDSLPVGSDTIIDKILITNLGISGFATAGEKDTLFNTADSVDLRRPIKIKVWAPDLQHTKEYTIEVRIHKQDPDSIQWSRMSNSFSGSSLSGFQKSVILKDQIFIYTSPTKAYQSAITDGRSWKQVSLSGLPDDTKLSSLIRFEEKIYVTTESGKVHSTTNGSTWAEESQLNNQGSVYTLLAGFPQEMGMSTAGIAGIINDGGTLKFSMSNANASSWNTPLGETVPTDFPTGNWSSTVYISDTGIPTAITVGNSTDTATVAWGAHTGNLWAALSTNTSKYCPKLTSPSIAYYNKSFFVLGQGFETFYSSVAGLYWEKADDKFYLPKEIKGRKDYSMVIDKNNFIWLIWSTGVAEYTDEDGNKIRKPYTNEVWRGRINKLGFREYLE